jgi:hypothetical protein
MRSVLDWAGDVLGPQTTPLKPKRGVKFHDILYSLSPDILYSLVMNPPQPWEGKWETLCVFQGGKAAVFSSFVGANESNASPEPTCWR